MKDATTCDQAGLQTIIEDAGARDWAKTWANADRILEELRRTDQKFSDSTESLREDRER
jgi:hypothetical protein